MLIRFERALKIAIAVTALGVLPASSQVLVDLDDGTSVTVATKFNRPIGFAPAQDTASLQSNIAGVAFYSANYTSFGKANIFNIVGTDPSLGAATTTVPTVIVPLKFIFPNTGNPTLDGTNVVTATMNSPIFQLADYTTGGTDLGITQFGDAIQRAEFWNLPGFSQNGYHVLLGTPSVAATITITVPSGLGNLYGLRSGGTLGVVDTNSFEALLNTLIQPYTANQVPIFLTDNVFLGDNGLIQNCCILGFHTSQGPPAATSKTWIYAAYTEAGTFANDAILDVHPLSHEVAEWLNDPFLFFGGVNLIPPAVLPGTGGACIINFETGDPLESPPIVFTKVTNGTTYHLQDEVFMPWYLHGPSFSVNGWYTFLNTFTTPAALCGPG
jgi:hypothetical protein